MLVDPVMSEGVEPATDCREAGFMMTNSSATTVTTPATAATRAATLSSAARRSESRVCLAGPLIAFESSEAGGETGKRPHGFRTRSLRDGWSQLHCSFAQPERRVVELRIVGVERVLLTEANS